MFGAERGGRLVAFAGGTAELVFDLIARHGMDVPHAARRLDRRVRAITMKALAGVESAGEAMGETRHAGAAAGQGRDAGRREAQAAISAAGWTSAAAASAAARATPAAWRGRRIEAGAVVHGGTPVAALDRVKGRWRMRTAARATVTAEQRAARHQRLHRGAVAAAEQTIIAANSFQVAATGR